MDIKIRPAFLSDLPYIYHICLKTGLSGKDARHVVSDAYIIGQYFAAPYCNYELDLCFVVTKDLIPVGYILGASKTDDFNKWMNREWLPHLATRFIANVKKKDQLDCIFRLAQKIGQLLPFIKKQGFYI